MFRHLVQLYKTLRSDNNSRSHKITKNIALSFLVKAGSILVGFAIIPITIDYVNVETYGIWITISSLVSWLSFFDVGMGNGLRNKLAESMALGNYINAKKYISTTYATLSILSLFIFLLFFTINPFIDWYSFLNISHAAESNIHGILLIICGAFCIQFVLILINNVLTSLHEPALAGFITLLGQILLLIAIVIIKTFVKGSLQLLVILLNTIPIIITLLFSIILYNGKLKKFAPSFKNIEFKFLKEIFSIGGAFFIIQLGSLVLIQTDNIIISKVLGAVEVTNFNVVYKYFSIVIMIFSIILTPYWSAFTDAYTKNDFFWLQSSVYKLRRIWFFFAFFIIPLMVFGAKFFIKLWIGEMVSINFIQSIAMGLYAINYICLILNCYFLNGVGKVRIQLLSYLVVCIINVPLGFRLAHAYGIEGVVFSNIITIFFMNVIFWIQSNKILTKKASGIWNI